MTTAITMLHSNAGELDQLYATFTRVWGEGGGASLSLETVDGQDAVRLQGVEVKKEVAVWKEY